MNSIDLIRRNLVQSENIVLSRIEDMQEHSFVFPTTHGGCHTLWVLGHIAYIEALVVQEFMLAEPNPLSEWKELFDGDDVVLDATRYPSFEVVLAKCREMRQSTVQLLDSFAENDLDNASQACPKGVEDLFGTYRHCFQYVSDHWYMHRGQLADARCAAGIERMWY